MGEAVVQLKIAGQTYRVVTSASSEDLGRLAERVDDALRAVTPQGRQPAGEQALVLAAITLANELEEERSARLALEARYESKLRELLLQVEAALGVEPRSDVAATQDFPTQEFPTQEFPAEELPTTTTLQEVYASRRLRERGAVGSQG